MAASSVLLTLGAYFLRHNKTNERWTAGMATSLSIGQFILATFVHTNQPLPSPQIASPMGRASDRPAASP